MEDELKDLVVKLIKTWLTKQFFKVTVVPGGIQGWLFEKIFTVLAEKVIIPLVNFLYSEAVISIDKIKVHASIQRLKEADNETDWNNAVDNLS